MRKILETQRLILREFNLDDAPFILNLVNAPNWLEFIGDKKVKTNQDAINYLKNGPLKSYLDYGFGLWLVQLKGSKTRIGMCGLVNRETLENIDIGFALLPEYSKSGYGIEMASATLNYAQNILKIDKIIAITDAKNNSSIRLLNKIGLIFEKELVLSKNDPVLVFTTPDNNQDKAQIDSITTLFFQAFTNTNNKIPQLEVLYDLFVPTATISNNTNGKIEHFTLQSFISPRKQLLCNGELTNFEEMEVSCQTEIYKNLAQRFCLYKKSGTLNGNYFQGSGTKLFQFVKVNNQWKINAVVWCDAT